MLRARTGQGTHTDTEPICIQKPPNPQTNLHRAAAALPSPNFCPETTLALNSEGPDVPKDTCEVGRK